MLTVKVRIRNMEIVSQGVVQLAEIKVRGEVLPPGEEREYEFTTEDDFKVKAYLTEAGEKLKKEIEEGDAAVADERKDPEKAAKARGEKKDPHKADYPGQGQANPLVSPGPKVENPQPSHGGAQDSRDVKGQAPLKR